MSRRAQAIVSVTVFATLFLSGCVSGARNESSFSDKASTTASAAASEVATVRLTTQLLLDGRLQQNYAVVTISASEDALSSIAQSFSIVQPPDPTSDELRAQLETLLGDAADAVATARIMARRGDERAMTEVLYDLDHAAEQLEAAGQATG